MTIVETLVAVKEFFGPDGDNWARGARDAFLNPRSGRYGTCLLNAIAVQTGDRESETRRVIFKAFKMYPTALIHFNDTHQWPEVAALLDRAIEEAEKQGI